MRLVFFIATLEHGGAERQLSLLAPQLVRMGHQVDVFSLRSGVYADGLKSAGVGLHLMPYRSHYDPMLFLQVLRALNSVRPHFVVSWTTILDIIGGLVCTMKNIPWGLRESSSGGQVQPGAVKRSLRLAVSQQAALVFANSQQGLSYWKQKNRTALKGVVPNALDWQGIQRAEPISRANLHLPESESVLLFVGRFHEAKNLEVLIEAFALLNRKRPCHLLMAGDGPLLPAVRDQVHGLGLNGQVHFLGFRTDTWELLKSVDGCVAVSKYEGRPNAVIEAMGAGCPLVVSDIPAHREVVDEESAWFARVDSPSDIAQAINHLLCDSRGAAAKGALARRRAKAWTVERCAEQFLELVVQSTNGERG